jgi:tetratricopeptide (TPR) repeat protein
MLGREADAIKCYDRAIALNPRYKDAWYNKGYTFHGGDKLEESIRCYREAATLDPYDEVLWNNLGNALYNLDRYPESIPYFFRALDVNPRYEIAWNNIGNALDKMKRHYESIKYHDKSLAVRPEFDYALYAKGHAFSFIGFPEEGLELITRSLELNPHYEYAWLAKAEVQQKLGKLDEALDSVDNALMINPDFYEAWVLKAEILQHMGKPDETDMCYEEAFASLQRGLSQSPNDKHMLQSLADLHLRMKNSAAALETTEKLIHCYGNDERSQIIQATALLQNERYKEVVEYCTEMLEFPERSEGTSGADAPRISERREGASGSDELRVPRQSVGEAFAYFLTVRHQTNVPVHRENIMRLWSWELYHLMGNALFRQRRYMEAVKVYDEAIKLLSRKDDPWVIYEKKWFKRSDYRYDRLETRNEALGLVLRDKAHALVEMRDYERALSCVGSALKELGDGDTLILKGTILESLKRWNDALRRYDDVLKQDFKNSVAWCRKGIVLLKLGRIKEALSCLDVAIGLEPENEVAWCYRGVAALELDDPHSALKYVERAISLSEIYLDAWYYKGRILEKGGNQKEAARWYKKIARMNPSFKDIQSRLTRCVYQK